MMFTFIYLFGFLSYIAALGIFIDKYEVILTQDNILPLLFVSSIPIVNLLVAITLMVDVFMSKD